jgi:L-alanine-DL-glutamate epimerase-like enolase superfamily enzyme
VGAAAALQFGACAPNLVKGVELIGSSAFTDDIITEPLITDHGVFNLPQKTGIGVEVDEAKLERYSKVKTKYPKKGGRL